MPGRFCALLLGALLLNGPLFSSSVEPPPGRLVFSLGSLEQGQAAAPPGPRKGRAILELSGFLAISTINYWLQYDRFIEDWEYQLTWKDQKRRFLSFDAWRFDSNCFRLNWTHAPAGAFYYNFGRANGVSPLGSLLLATGGSFWWEYFSEWREVVSVNDNLFTAFGAVSLGEPWYQIGLHFLRREGWVNGALSFLNPILKLNHLLDRGNPAAALPPVPGWDDFRLSVGFKAQARPSGGWEAAGTHARLRARIVPLPEYGQAGQTEGLVVGTLYTEFSGDLPLDGRGSEEFRAFGRTFLAGFFKQSLTPDRSGYSFSYGLGTAFTLFKDRSVAFYDSCKVKAKSGPDLRLDEPRDFRDKLSAVHMIGPFINLTRYAGDWTLRLLLDGYLDFGLVNSLPLNKFSREHDIRGMKTTLITYGYYYALGYTLAGEGSLEWKGCRVEASGRFHSFDSIEGADRYQKELTQDFDLEDSRWRLQLRVEGVFPNSPLGVLVLLERHGGHGRLLSVEETTRSTRIFAGLMFCF